MFYIFDWDGTLSDSTSKIVGCMQKAAADTSLEVLDEERIKNIIGLGLPQALNILYPDIPQQQKNLLSDSYVKHFVKDDVKPSPFFPGVMDTLEYLRDQGYLLAVATGKSRKGLNRVLQNLGMESFFHATRCADETASKPHPMMLHELLEEFSVGVAQAVMVGDTEYDMAMARSVDMAKIAVSYGAHHISRLQTYQPDLCIDEFGELLNWDSSLGFGL